jgi:hypothetical protein
MLVEILCNKLQLSFGHTVATSPSQVTAEQGSHVGKGLAFQLVWHGRAAPAIQAWVRQFPALQQLQALHPWVLVMVQQIAAALLTQASWGLHMRVLLCGLLTYLDLGSDLLVTKQYLDDGEVTGAALTLSFLAVNMSFQVALCVGQNFRNVPVMLREIFYTLILLKPALEVVRLLSSERHEPYQTFPLLQENAYSKGIEVATECLPAALTQLFFLSRATDPTALQLASIVVSIVTTAVTVASMDFNMSTDPRTLATEHAMAVRYLGLIPEGNVAEFRMFVVMVCCSSTQMAVAALGTALLADYDMRIALVAWVGRFVAMYTVKLVRRDLAYYLPIGGPMGVKTSQDLSRPLLLILSDFAFFLYGRHPLEMGCVQWWSGRVWAWLLLFAAVALRAMQPGTYDSQPLMTNATRAANQSIESLLRNASAFSGPPLVSAPWLPWLARPAFLAALAATLFILWLLSHLVFFCLCKRDCLRSFLATHTAAAYVRLKWDAAQSDEKRAAMLVKLHPDVLRLVAADARLWIESQWRESPDGRPAWMTERWFRAVPNSMLSKNVLKALGSKRRRRSTLVEQLEQLNDTALPDPNPVTLPNVIAASPDSIVVDAASSAESPAPELLAVVPSVAPSSAAKMAI